MGTLNQHIQAIKFEIATMTREGHIVDFEVCGCVGAIEYELDQIVTIDNDKEMRQT